MVDNPLETVHGGFVEFLFEEVILEWSGSDICADSDVYKSSIGCGAVEIGLRTIRFNSSSTSHPHAGSAMLVAVVWIE